MTTETDQTAVVIRDLARESTEPHEVEPGSIYLVPTAQGGVEKVDLTGDEYLEFPKRKRGTVTVRDVASFAHYYGRHSDGNSEVFADLDNATITAVLDAHQSVASGGDEGARWQAHRLALALRKTDPWQRWTGASGRYMAQQAFAEFLEANAADVAPDGQVSAADLLEVAQKFHMTISTEFQSGQRLADGRTHFVFIEKAEAKAGQRGELDVPSEFDLAIVPYDDCDPRRVKARFRYRQQGGTVEFAFVLDDPARIARAAVEEIVAKTAAETGAVIMVGSPG